ncbi:LacI family DNA-binding transcriptional regulator [Shinella sp.]|uniref:LacI family DNA-binding transcriptional regulator n=1 Tax=Shinella sp. TaxID=1870904 RepID=UPI003F7221F9
MRRVPIKDVISATGLSRATIDRALNGRGNIHPKTQKAIEEALLQLERAPDAAARATPSNDDIDIIYRLGRGLAEQFATTAALQKLAARLLDMTQKSDDEVYDAVERVCRHPERPLILTAKRNANLHALLLRARREGKRIVTLVSDLPGDTRDAFIGIDNRMAGQTAAFMIGNVLRERPAPVVGVVLGDHAFTCHEDREIGFRSNLRALFPQIRLTDAVKGEDSPEQTKVAVSRLVAENPDIAAIYNVGGGNQGMVDALKDAGLCGKVFVMTHEANSVTVPLMREDAIHLVISQRPEDLLGKAIKAARNELTVGEASSADFALYSKYNLPLYSTLSA